MRNLPCVPHVSAAPAVQEEDCRRRTEQALQSKLKEEGEARAAAEELERKAHTE